MSITPSYFKSVINEFASVSDSVVQTFIDEAVLYVNRSKWGAKADFAEALMTAHLMKLVYDSTGGVGGSSSGVISEKKVGDLSVKYATASSATIGLDSTKYGELYKSMAKSILKTPIVLC